ncbi:MAG TPA: MerR family transcriptional regulator, partial [Actinomycetota bacterium]|nr:MerR family transcriptional regulator [Actinomycetota bacterium]
MSIGEVLGILKPEFPDITVSKIRFLEGAGLVQPDRSASGYRKFSEDDVARLRFVLRAQRDQYLPLRVIRQRLADLENVGDLDAKGGLPPDPTSQPDPGAPAAAWTPESGAAGAGPAGSGASGAGAGVAGAGVAGTGGPGDGTAGAEAAGATGTGGQAGRGTGGGFAA